MDELIMDFLYRNELTCPECGNKQVAEMSVSRNEYVFDCKACYEVIQSNGNECCIHCQYGKSKCPKEQVRLN